MKSGDVAGVVLAAGEGRRFGGFKAFATYEGTTLLARAVRALADAGCRHVVVVTNPGWPPGPHDTGAAELVVNPGWAEGMGSSLRLALSTGTVAQAEAAVVMLADTPLVGAECVRRVVAAGSGRDALVQATYDGRRGHPVLVGRDHFAGVRQTARGDVGARNYLAAHAGELVLVECADAGRPADIDTPADLERLRAAR